MEIEIESGTILGTNNLPYEEPQRGIYPTVEFKIVELPRKNGIRNYLVERLEQLSFQPREIPQETKINGYHRLVQNPAIDLPRLFIAETEILAIARDNLNGGLRPKGKQIPAQQLKKEAYTPKRKALRSFWKSQTNKANVTCPITGISYQISTQGIQNWTFIQPHPFAFYGNVSEYLRQIRKEGKSLAHLSKNELAGMILSCLRHWKFLSKWQEAGSLNILLQECSEDLLVRAISIYSRLSSSEGMPGITFSLVKTEEVLANHLSLISGKHWLDVGERKYQTNQTPVKARVVSRKDKFAEWKSEGLDLIRYLKAGANQINQRRLKEIASFLKIPEHCGSQNARMLAKEVQTRFPENQTAIELAEIFLEIAIYSETKIHGKDDFETISQETTIPLDIERLSISEMLAKKLSRKGN